VRLPRVPQIPIKPHKIKTQQPCMCRLAAVHRCHAVQSRNPEIRLNQHASPSGFEGLVALKAC